MSVTTADLPTSESAAPEQPIGVWLFFVGTAALVVSLAQTILIPVLGILPDKLDASVADVQWLLTSTLLVGAVAVPVMGKLGDMFGKRLLLLVAVAALAIGSVVTVITDNLGVMIAGRAIAGISAAAIPLGISLLSSLVPRERAGVAIATVSAMLGVGGALGLPFAAAIAQNADYHVLFWVSAAVAALSMIGIALKVPKDTQLAGGKIDLVGALLLSGALVALLLPLAQSSSWGWGSARVIGLLITSAVLFAVFTFSQTRIGEPLLDLATLRTRPIMLTNIAAIFFGFALFASMIGTASYVQAPESTGYGFGSSILTGGLAMLPAGLAMLVFAPLSAKLSAKIGAPRVLTIGALIVAGGWVGRMVFIGSLTEVIVWTTVVGVGSAIGYASMPTIINAHTPVTELAAANGVNSLVRSVGSSLASAIGGAILAAKVLDLGGHEIPTLAAYRELFAICAIASVIAALIALAIPAQPSADA
jgi:MFS family permease